jgi:hypothetical protein
MKDRFRSSHTSENQIFYKFYSVEEINPKLNILVENFDKIHQEFIDNKDKLIWTNWHGSTGYRGENTTPYEGWQIAGLCAEYPNEIIGMNVETISTLLEPYEKNYQQKLYPNSDKNIIFTENSKHFPILMECLDQIGIRKRIAISVVYPGKSIKWHIDADPEDEKNVTIRGLFGLDIHPEKDHDCYICLGNESEYEKKYFRNNEFVFFWGKMGHCVINTLQTPRYVICLDQDVSKDYLRTL